MTSFPLKKLSTLPRRVTFSGFLILSAAVLFLYGFTFYEALIFHSLLGALILLLIIGICAAIYHEGRQLLIEDIPMPGLRHLALDFLAVLVSALITYVISHDIGLGPVVAASLVGVMAYLLVPEHSVPAYCGAFTGMSSNDLLYTHAELVIAGLITALVFVIARQAFIGAGGRLGAVAMVGTLVTGGVLRREFVILPLPSLEDSVVVVLVSLIATLVTFYLHIDRSAQPVLASAVVGLAGGLILPVIFPETGYTLSVVMICASFTGMTIRERCPRFWSILLTGLFTGIVFVYTTPHLAGAGGKLGTIGFGSVLAVCGFHFIGRAFQARRKAS